MNIKRNILLNPGPSTTTDTVKMAQVVPDICPREKEFGGIMKPMRDDLVRIVHGDIDDYTAVLFCGSGTICIDITLNSLLDEGKKAFVINNGSYSSRACEVIRAYGLPLIELKQPIYEKPSLEEIEKVLKENPDVGYVYMTHHETGSGLLNPIREVGALAHKYGALLIFDEVVSGFRYHLGGASGLYKVVPDMAAFGKGMGNGYAISAVAGRKEIMKLIEEGVFVSTTFGGDASCMAAALATIKILEQPGFYEYIWKLGDKMKTGVSKLITKYGLENVVSISGLAPHCGVAFEGIGNLSYLDINTVYSQVMIENGIVFRPSVILWSL